MYNHQRKQLSGFSMSHYQYTRQAEGEKKDDVIVKQAENERDEETDKQTGKDNTHDQQGEDINTEIGKQMERSK